MVLISEDREQVKALIYRASYTNIANTSIARGVVCCAKQLLINDGCSNRCPINVFGVMNCSKYIKIIEKLR